MLRITACLRSRGPGSGSDARGSTPASEEAPPPLSDSSDPSDESCRVGDQQWKPTALGSRVGVQWRIWVDQPA